MEPPPPAPAPVAAAAGGAAGWAQTQPIATIAALAPVPLDASAVVGFGFGATEGAIAASAASRSAVSASVHLSMTWNSVASVSGPALASPGRDKGNSTRSPVTVTVCPGESSREEGRVDTGRPVGALFSSGLCETTITTKCHVQHEWLITFLLLFP